MKAMHIAAHLGVYQKYAYGILNIYIFDILQYGLYVVPNALTHSTVPQDQGTLTKEQKAQLHLETTRWGPISFSVGILIGSPWAILSTPA